MTISYFLENLKDYKNDLKFCKNSEIKIFNFWSLNTPESLWFHQFITQRKLLKKGHSISLYSVFGDRFKMKLDFFRPKIFFTGENSEYRRLYIDHCLNSVNLSLGSEYVDAANYIRFPLWYLYFIKSHYKLAEIKAWTTNVNESNKRLNRNKKFCSLVAGHDPIGYREIVFNSLSQIKQVDSGGNFKNNTDDLHSAYNNDKRLFLENYRFNICLENSNKNGYVTEKIFESIVAGSLPVYWGSDLNPEPDILNRDRILFFNPHNPEEVKKQIERLEVNSNLYNDFYLQDVFSPLASEIIYDKLEQLDNKIREILD